ncbi:hypothetical protein [Tunturibacter empetritectus]|uniref:Uncharacterized protein n=1 Tax=Tunturiibacter lichenicola TaxID=2051959 RepID=A0A7W8J7I3_9BACT|nr:hypothetical protein [Edaphobacter lichenicola]MBB5343011.1 hypothetical protein [Edaphobacter lichenicola]
MRHHPVSKAVKIALFAVVASVVLGFVVKSLWNALMPPIFGWHMITFWQGLGLFVLSKILFGGFHRHGGGRNRWRQGMKERWEQMTPEDREKFRKGMRCGRGPFASHAETQI